MSNEFSARHLDIKSLANLSASLSGQEPVANFPRLLQELDARSLEREIAWAASGELRAGAAGQEQVWLHLKAQTVFPLTCQRCLGAVEVDVSVAQSFRFVATEAQAETEDEMAEEDVLVLERAMDLLGLVEDEVLMALPVIPRHEVCPDDVQLVAQDPDFEESAGTKVNPFAALAKLKTGKAS